MTQTIGKIPEFTTDEPTPVDEKGQKVAEKSSAEAAAEEVVEEEKETPSEPPAEEKPEEEGETPILDDASLQSKKQQLLEEIVGLEHDRQKILDELQLSRGARREIHQEELKKATEKLEELEDVHPDDVKKVEQILRLKGHVSQEDIKKMLYENTVNDVKDEFLETHPEYKKQNDPHDIRWNSLMEEFKLYRMPDSPKKVKEILDRAHKSILERLTSDRPQSKPENKKQKVAVASLGGGGGQRSSSSKTLTAEQRLTYQLGGWSEEEIIEIEKNLT